MYNCDACWEKWIFKLGTASWPARGEEVVEEAIGEVIGGVEYGGSSKRERGSPELGVERARGSVMRREVVAGKARR